MPTFSTFKHLTPIGLTLLLLSALQFLPEFVSSYGVLFLLITAGYTGYREGIVRKFAPWHYALLLYFCWQLLGLTYSSNPKAGLEIMGMQLMLVLVPWALFSLKNIDLKTVQIAFLGLWISTFLAAVYVTGNGLVRTFSQTGNYGFYASHYLYYTELAEALMHPAYFSLLVVMALVGAFWLRQQGLFPGRWYWVGQSWLLVFLLLLSARMTLLAFGFSSLLMLMHYGYRSGRIRLLLSSLLGALAFALAVFFILPERLQQRFTELTEFEYDISAPLLTDFNGLTIRLAEWRGVFVAMDGHFWLGHGTGAGYEALQAANAQTGFQVGIDYNYNAHNQWLEGALSNGFVSILLLMAIFVLAFHHARTQGNWLGVWFLIFFFFCIQSESMLIRHRGALFFALYLSLTLLAGSLTKSASRPASRD